MAAMDCIAEIQKAAGRALSVDEMDDLLSELQRRIDERRRIQTGEDLDTTVRRAADDYAKEMAAAAVIEKRNAIINLKRRLEAVDAIRTKFADNPGLGLEAVLVGVNRPVKGARRSAAQEQNMLKKYYLGGFMSEMEKAGLWREFASGEFDGDIARALWSLNRSEPSLPPGLPKEAVQMAKVIAKWQEVARQDTNAAGGWVKKLEGYITRQSHDMYKIRSAGYDAWRAEILPRLDLARTLDGEREVEPFLKAVYSGLASGIHLKSADANPSGFKGPRNIAKKASAERVLHFKSADDWTSYNERFGMGSLREALMRSFEMSAQTTGLMRRLGTNPEANFQRIADEIIRGIDDPVKKQKLADLTKGKLRNQLRVVDGTTRMPVSHAGAQISSYVRAVQAMAKLGGALLSQFSDLPAYASEMRYQGGSMLSGLAEGLTGMLRGRGSDERREIGGMIGVVSDSMAGQIANRFSVASDDVPGMMTRLQQLFFKFNGMTWWTDSLRRAAQESMSHRLALNVGKGYRDIDPDLQRVLGLYGIDEGRWNIVRRAATKEADGRSYLVPEAIADLPDQLFGELLSRDGIAITDRRIADLKRDIADQLRTYFVDRAEYAVISADQRTAAFMQRGTQPGTVEGEVLRFVGQFKSFPVAFTQKAIGREIYGRGANSLGEALRNGNGEMLGMAQLILWTTAFGYLSMSAKDLAKGRTPRDPLDPKTWQAAMLQGGGMGIYGDFLFGEVKNRFGGGLVSTLAGPTLGTVEDVADLWGRIREGDDVAAASFKLMLSNTPFMNLFYTRVVLDYLILHRIGEWLNPGSLKRMEARIEKENAQTFLVRPSEMVQ